MRVETSSHVIWRFVAYVLPACGAMLLVIGVLELTGVSHQLATATAIAYLLGGALLLAFLWLRTGLVLDVDAQARTLTAASRRAYLPPKRTVVPFDRLRALRVVRTPGWLVALATCEDRAPVPLTVLLPRNADGEARLAELVDRVRGATGRPLPLV